MVRLGRSNIPLRRNYRALSQVFGVPQVEGGEGRDVRIVPENVMKRRCVGVPSCFGGLCWWGVNGSFTGLLVQAEMVLQKKLYQVQRQDGRTPSC